MKTIHYLFIISAFILTGSLFYACTKEQDNSIDATGEFEFAISATALKDGNGTKGAAAYTLADADKIILTIQNIDGSDTKYTSSEVKILQMNGNYYTQKLALKTGTYKLTEFVLIDASGNTIYASPLAGSQEAQNITNPLPIVFTVAKNTASPVNVQVLSTAAHTPEDFGLSHFPVTEIKTLSFMIGVIDNSSDGILPAKLTVSNGAYAYVKNLSSVLNNVVTVTDGLPDYTLTVEYTGFVSYTHTYTIDSLKIFEDAPGNLPLLVELEKVNDLTVTDIDGNVYHTVTIGTQVWMVENLKTTKYRNGDLIGTTTPATLDISGETTPKYQWAYGGNESNVATYGRLYTWYAATDSRNVCPAGWHVPTDAEWTTLSFFLGNGNVVGGKLKETGISHWAAPNTGATNESGFTALPGAYRYFDGGFYDIGLNGDWWSSTESSSANAYYRTINYGYSDFYRPNLQKFNGFSVRCLKD